MLVSVDDPLYVICCESENVAVTLNEGVGSVSVLFGVKLFVSFDTVSKNVRVAAVSVPVRFAEICCEMEDVSETDFVEDRS